MLFTATTVKDTTENIESFVRGNLRGGADHMLLFIEGDDAETQTRVLDQHPHVTAIATDSRYWRGARPDRLNPRQGTNATLAATVLAALPWADWLFHIDGDENLHLDRNHLDSLPAAVPAVRLRTLEAASDGTGDVRLFKRELTRPQLRDLHARGLIGEPRNSVYFRGHLQGKPGARPSPFIRMGVHKVRTHHGADLVHHEHPSLRVLHHEAVTAEAFIRKWRNLAMAGASHGRSRRVLAERVRAILLDETASSVVKEARLREVYDACGRDDVETLDRMGLLVAPDLTWHEHEPVGMDPEQSRTFRAVLDLLLEADKRSFNPRHRHDYPLDVLRAALSSRRVRRRPEIAEPLRFALTR